MARCIHPLAPSAPRQKGKNQINILKSQSKNLTIKNVLQITAHSRFARLKITLLPSIMKKYDYSIMLSHDENGANCTARITHFSEAGQPSLNVNFDEVRGDNKDEVLNRAMEMVQNWIDNRKE